MKFKINGQEYQLEFGMKFINELDKRYSVNYEGFKFGMGVNMAFMYLNQYNPTVLQNIISAAVSHEKNKPSEKKIEEAIIEYATENDGLGQLFEELIEELGKSPLLKATIKRFQEMAVVQEQ